MAVDDTGPAGSYQEQDYLAREIDHYAGKKYELILSWLGGHGVGHVLNLGCGSGELNTLLARRGYTVDAVDPSPAAVSLAERRRREGGLAGITVWQADVFGLSATAAYDAIVCLDVLEHIEDDVAAARRIAALLRAGGRLLVSVPAMQWLFGYHDEQLGHYRRYSRARLTALLDECFVVRRARFFGFSLIPVALLYSRLLRRPYPVEKSASTVGRLVLAFEGAFRFPVGTSLLMEAEKPSRAEC